MRTTARAGHWAVWALTLGGLLLAAGAPACAAASRAAQRSANASVVIVARGMLEGQLTPIG